MSRPRSFSWVHEKLLAASAFPSGAEELSWLRENGVDIIITLTESSLPRHWVDDAGIMSVHIPVADFEPPNPSQLKQCIDVIDKAATSGMGVLVHCRAGQGRTGTVLAAYLISHLGLNAEEAIQRIRSLRPGSIESPWQERALLEFASNRVNRSLD
jgi:atypical dual specificity phosphatase